MSALSNFTFDEIEIGQTANYTKQITQQDIEMFAAISGDVNPVHLNADFAAGTQFKQPIAHGMFTGAIVSAAIAMELPGPGTIYLGQSLRFKLPVLIGDTIRIELEVTEKRDGRQFVTLDCKAINQNGKIVATGIAEVMAPPEKLEIERPQLPTYSATV